MKKLLSTACSDAAFGIAMFVLRVTFGLLLCINHGFAKMSNFGTLKYKFFDPFHIGSQWSLTMAIFAEVFCAIFVVLGLFTRLAAIPIVILLAVATFLFHKGQPMANHELAVIYLAAFLAILFAGPGKYSVDGAMGR